MAVTIGTLLGRRYQILALLGGGGMGEVYRGRDTELGRDVAIKVLPAAVASNATRRARFEREARVISQLSHPNICAIYDVGEHDGLPYLVMEYIDGTTLEQRLRAGALRWPAALQIGIQIASAVAIAHRHGIVHRDLKPANIMQTGSTIKLLDFGIAKLVDDERENRAEARTVGLTEEHKIVGTLNYMAPEQLERRPIDGRADIFALGALLYETLTGRKAFDGANSASVTAAVIASDPPPLSPPTYRGPTVPQALEHIVRRALAKSPDDRWQTADDLAQELEWVAEDPQRASAPLRSTSSAWRVAAFVMTAALVMATGAWGGWRFGRPRPVLTTFTIAAPGGTQFGTGMGKVAVSPDGSKIAFVALTKAVPSIWLYELDSGQSRQLPETDGAQDPFWSPSSQSLGFFADNGAVIKRIDVAGGPARKVTDVKIERPIGHEIGACWMPDDTIAFPLSDGLYRVPATGGTPSLFIRPDPSRNERGMACSFPVGAGRLLYRVRGISNSWHDLVGGASGNPIALPNIKSTAVPAAGYLLFHDGTRLLAQPFDDQSSELRGQPVEIAPTLDINLANYRGNFSASADVLAYFPETAGAWTWIDRFGHRFDTLTGSGRFGQVAVARDGSNRVALGLMDRTGQGHGQIWMQDGQGRPWQLTHDLASGSAVWSPDGRWIAYERPVPGGGSGQQVHEFHRTSSTDAGEDDLILQRNGPALPLDWSRDGRFLIYSHRGDIWAVSLLDHMPRQITNVGIVDRAARLSLDGRWLAYMIPDKGQHSVWVQRFPDGETPTRVPGADGFDPAWSPDGRELYYMGFDGTLMAVPMSVSGGAQPVFGAPVGLFSILPMSMSFNLHVFSVAPDGRFLVAEPPIASDRIIVTVNWTAAIRP
jgi:Tol biopolymer transport system component/predicted Ser/Thr protein kinase